jgi:type IV secretory pathway VirB2 component (pilin)
MKLKRVFTLTVPMVLCGASAALAAGSGTPLDGVATQLVTLLSGPVALVMIAAGFVGAGIVYFAQRDFGHAFLTMAGLVVGGVLCSQVLTMATFLFPGAIALIR